MNEDFDSINNAESVESEEVVQLKDFVKFLDKFHSDVSVELGNLPTKSRLELTDATDEVIKKKFELKEKIKSLIESKKS